MDLVLVIQNLVVVLALEVLALEVLSLAVQIIPGNDLITGKPYPTTKEIPGVTVRLRNRAHSIPILPV